MRQLTSLDAQFLAMESARQYGHVGGLAILDPSTRPGGLDLAAVQELIGQRLPLVPPLRWRLAEVPLSLDYSYWVDDPDFDLANEHEAEVEINVPALIPDDYLPDVNARLTLYKRISSARGEDELRDLQVEMIDRFGLLPDPVKNLFAVTLLKLAATPLGIKKLELGANGGRVTFRPQPNVEPLTIIKMIQAQPRVYALDGQDKLRFKMPLEGTAERLRAANDLLSSLGAPKAA